MPDVPKFLYGTPKTDGSGFEFVHAENPNRPEIRPETRAVAGAVVFLRGVSPAAKLWDLPPVQVEFSGRQIVVVQGNRRGRCGFVRVGDTVTFLSSDPTFHVIRGRGDAFFAQTLPEPNAPVRRILSKPGRVELSSGTGLYWARADLFVLEHPYASVTDTDGRFTFTHVPPGRVEVVVWLPGWTPAIQERDPDSTAITRQTYAPPIEKTATALVDPAHPAESNLSIP